MDKVVNLPNINTTVYAKKKNSPVSTGAKIGAGLGVLAGAGNTYINRGLISQIGDAMMKQGASKVLTRASQVMGVGVGIVAAACAAALIGAGIGKIVSHYKNKGPKGVIPEEKISPKDTPKVKPGGVLPGVNPNNPFTIPGHKKPDKLTPEEAQKLRKVETEKGDEYYIKDGHPKEVYKKNKETGEIEFKSAVYDGSWGPELSDDNLIKSMERIDAMKEKFGKDGYGVHIGPDGKPVSYTKQTGNDKVTDYSKIFNK